MLIKRAALLVMIFTLSLSISALADEPGKGVIEGQLINGTTGGSSVADQDITLKTYLNDAEAGETTARTDADGWFIFDGLSTESGYSYQVVITFHEVEYSSEWLSLNEGETAKSTKVTVYDTTTSDESISVAMSHTIMYVEQGSLRVKEYFLFVNASDRTYIGSEEVFTPGGRKTLRFPLPKEATELQYVMGLMECCIVGSEDGFIDTMPVLPGMKEVVYSYKVDYDSGAYIFSRQVSYPMVSYDLLIEGEGTEVASSQLTTEELLEIEGRQFSHLSGDGFAPGDILVTYLSGLPKTDNQGVIMWTAVALAVLTGGFGLNYVLKKKRTQPVSPEDSLDRKRQRLLIELAQLDDDFEDGKIDEESYRRLRAERKAHLVEFAQRSKEESGRR